MDDAPETNIIKAMTDTSSEVILYKQD